MSDYATITDVVALWRALTDEEVAVAERLLPLVSSELRFAAKKVGKNLDAMVSDDDDLAEVAKSVTVDVVKRYINDNKNDSVSMSQMSQAAGGYSVSGTFLVPGGGLFIKKSELSRLGLRRARYGVIDLNGN